MTVREFWQGWCYTGGANMMAILKQNNPICSSGVRCSSSADCVPNEVSMHHLSHCGSIALMLPFLLAKGPQHGFDYHLSFKRKSVSLQNMLSIQCLPVRAGRVSSATAISWSVIILRNDVSMLVCHITKAWSKLLQLHDQPMFLI